MRPGPFGFFQGGGDLFEHAQFYFAGAFGVANDLA